MTLLKLMSFGADFRNYVEPSKNPFIILTNVLPSLYINTQSTTNENLLCRRKKYLAQLASFVFRLSFTNVTVTQGWATSLVGGPYVGRQSPYRAGLLYGSSLTS